MQRAANIASKSRVKYSIPSLTLLYLCSTTPGDGYIDCHVVERHLAAKFDDYGAWILHNASQYPHELYEYQAKILAGVEAYLLSILKSDYIFHACSTKHALLMSTYSA